MSDVWTEARQIALRAGASWVGTDMLLAGLTRSGGVAQDVFAEAGVTDAVITSDVIELNRSAARPPNEDTDEYPRPTPAADHARGRAEGFAIALEITDPSVAMLLALLYDRTGVHSSELRRAGADRGAIVRALEARGVRVPPTMPPPEPEPFADSVILPDEQARVVAGELARRSVEDQAYWSDPWGKASWGYGGIAERPGEARISGERRINLVQLVPEILIAHGYPAPPEGAWEELSAV
jgi:hypothetical protein